MINGHKGNANWDLRKEDDHLESPCLNLNSISSYIIMSSWWV